jgi:hypothetical protein
MLVSIHITEITSKLNRQLAGCADQRGRGPLSLDIQHVRFYEYISASALSAAA